MNIIYTLLAGSLIYFSGLLITARIIRRWSFTGIEPGDYYHQERVASCAVLWPFFWLVEIFLFGPARIARFLWDLAYGKKEIDNLKTAQEVARRLRNE